MKIDRILILFNTILLLVCVVMFMSLGAPLVSRECGKSEVSTVDSSFLFQDTTKADTLVETDTLIVYTYHSNGMVAMMDVLNDNMDFKIDFRLYLNSFGDVVALVFLNGGANYWRCFRNSDVERFVNHSGDKDLDYLGLLSGASYFLSRFRVVKTPFACEENH